MSEIDTTEIIRADDGFERHYAEKIWSLIPEIYRHEDGIAAEPGQLRAFVEILAEQAAIARRSVDRLWADTRVDEADDWALSYIAALLGTRPVNSRNRAAERANIGRTILYRRRQGTPRLLELLADDIADWDAVAAEAFKRLFRHWHMLDDYSGAGPITGQSTSSPLWGYANVRAVRISDFLDEAHSDLSHHPDFRRSRGVLGRYNIPKVNLHLFRQYAFRLRRVTPFRLADELYTFDPSGRDGPLFQRGGRILADCVEAREWEMRAPIPCRRLNAASFKPERIHAPVGIEDELAPIYGRRFATETGMLDAANAALAEDPIPPGQLTDAQSAQLIDNAMEAATPRRNLLPGGERSSLSVAIAVAEDFDAEPMGPQHLYGANLAEWAQDHGVPGWVEALVDPQLGRLRLMDPLAADRDVFVQRIYYGIFWPVGAGAHDRAAGLAEDGFTPVTTLQPDFTVPQSGHIRFMDSRTYDPLLPADGVIEVDDDLTLTAANLERPYITLNSAGDTVTIRSTNPEAMLTIDGLWLGVFGGAASSTRLLLDGDWRQVTIRNCTIDPGGERAALVGQPPETIPSVQLAFSGAFDHIQVDSSILGRVDEVVTGPDPCATDTVTICNSIILGNGNEPTVQLRNAELTLENCTIFGDLVSGQLWASQVLVDGLVQAVDKQSGCFRFGAATAGGSVPHPYESHFYASGLPSGTFVSRRFGDPGLAQLSEIAPVEIRTGGEGGTEIGAYNQALDPIKRADLRNKIDEFMPINAITQLVFET